MNRNLRNRLRRSEQKLPIAPDEHHRAEALARMKAERSKVLAHPYGLALLAEMEMIEARYREDCPSELVWRQRLVRDGRWGELASMRVAIVHDIPVGFG
jgi:hypothetical protein